MSDLQDAKESLGSYLKRNREDRNISVEQVAYATRISLKMLRALEEDDHTALPASTFVRGYLQAYAKYVRLDTQDLLLRYQHHLATAPDTKKNSIRSHYLYVRERYQEKRRLVLIIVLFATMLSVAGTYFMLKAKREHNKRLAQTAEQIQRQIETQPSSNGLISVKESPAEEKVDTAATSTKPEKKEAVVTEKPSDVKKEKVVADEKTSKTNTPAKTVEAPKVPEPLKAAEVAKPAENKPAEPKVSENKPVEVKPTDEANKASDAKPSNQHKTYNLLVKSKDVDVWFRYQTDTADARNIVLKAGNKIMLRADKVVKIFSGNLGALQATQDGKEVNMITSPGKSKSFVWPLSEAANYPLPLFPDIQSAKKPDSKKNDAKQGVDKKDEGGNKTEPSSAEKPNT